MPMTPKEMVRLLNQYGYVEISQNGSHKKLYNKELKKGLEQSILKQAGIK